MQERSSKSRPRQRFGSIKIVNGAVYARVQYIDDRSGKRKEKTKRARDRRHARELLSTMQIEMKTIGRSAFDHDKVTFGQVAVHYENTKVIPAIFQNGIKVAGKRSVASTKSSIKPLVVHFGNRKIAAIRPSDVEAYKLMRLNTPVLIETNCFVADETTGRKKKIKTEIIRPRKIASVNRELELLRAIFNFAKSEEIVTKTPFENKTKLISTSAEYQRDRVMSFEEEQRLLEVCSGSKDHLRALIIVAVDTAMRRGELFKLQWAEVDLFSREIRIQASNAKTERARTVGLTQRCVDELGRLWELSDKNPNTLVFGITSSIKNAWKSACSEAAIDELRFHDLRHTATTRFVRSGVPASEVMKLTGHTQIKTFLRYLNLTKESVKASAVLLDKYLNQGSEISAVDVTGIN